MTKSKFNSFDQIHSPTVSYAQKEFGSSDDHHIARLMFTEADQERLLDLAGFGSINMVENEFHSVLKQGWMEPLRFDLVITRISDKFQEFDKVTPYMGDFFSYTAYGAAPVVLDISGILLDSANNNAKRTFFSWYKEVFRISKVARYKVAPILAFQDAYIKGAFVNLNFMESAQEQNGISVNFGFLVLNAFYYEDATAGEQGVNTQNISIQIPVDYGNASWAQKNQISFR